MNLDLRKHYVARNGRFDKRLGIFQALSQIVPEQLAVPQSVGLFWCPLLRTANDEHCHCRISKKGDLELWMNEQDTCLLTIPSTELRSAEAWRAAVLDGGYLCPLEPYDDLGDATALEKTEQWAESTRASIRGKRPIAFPGNIILRVPRRHEGTGVDVVIVHTWPRKIFCYTCRGKLIHPKIIGVKNGQRPQRWLWEVKRP